MLDIVMDELQTVADKHGDARRSYIEAMPLSMDREDLVEEQPIVISLSQENYIRHLRGCLPPTEPRRQGAQGCDNQAR